MASKARGPLVESLSQTIFYFGAPDKVRLIVVCEPSSKEAIERGQCWDGPATASFFSAVSESGLSRSEVCFIASSIRRAEWQDKKQDPIVRDEAPRVLRDIMQVRAVAPEAVGLVHGKWPLKQLTGFQNLPVARGFVWHIRGEDPKEIGALSRKIERLRAGASKSKKQENVDALQRDLDTMRGRDALAGWPFVPTFAPSWLSRADTWMRVGAIDVARACRLGGRGVSGIGELSNIGPYRVGGPELFREVPLGPVVSLDIETSGIKPLETDILCVGVSDGENTVVLHPWDDKWIPLLRDWLSTRELVVCHNGNFDRMVLEAHGL